MVFEKVKQVVAKSLNIDEEKITMETNLVSDLGADSIDAVEIIMELEEEFNLQFDDESSQNIKLIGDLVRYIEERLNK